MSVSVVDSCLMTSHRELFPVVASLNKLSLTPTERYKCVVPPPQEDMITDKDEVPPKPQPQQTEVSVSMASSGAFTVTTLKPHQKACVHCLKLGCTEIISM